MIVWNTTVTALVAIRRNAGRSLLTALGVVIGVASVIAMVNLGRSVSLLVTGEIATLGPNLVFVLPGTTTGFTGATTTAQPFELGDAEAIAREVADVTVAAASSTTSAVAYGRLHSTTSLIGTTAEYLEVRSARIERGRWFEPRELSSGATVCVVGQTIVEDVYDGADPLGTDLRIGRSACQVVGVLASKGSSMGQDQDDAVILPLRAVHRRITGGEAVTVIYVSANIAGIGERVERDIRSILRERRGLRGDEADDFAVRDTAEVAATLTNTTRSLTALVGAIASVSLLVGGIGIMNIMLVSVTERTREIGIRLAIGARATDVLTQFLIEALVLSATGGVIGIAVGLAITWAVVAAAGWALVVSWGTIALSFGVSAAVGVVFGYLPARRAAALEPIAALRHE
jgi:putative ABC transport system permease protein